MHFKKLYISLFFSLSLLFSSATITGKINDLNSKEPLIGANVVLLETTRKLEFNKKTITVQTNTNYGASSDIKGEFIIKNVPLGEYDLRDVLYTN